MTESNPDTEDQQEGQSPSDDSVQPSMTMHPLTYSGVPMTMYPFPQHMINSPPARTKRRQVKNACTNCQKACKKCDDARPCLRCVKYGVAEECIDSQRKERQKGIKRGPYKKRDGKSNTVEQQLDVSVQPGIPIPAAVAAPGSTPPIPFMAAPMTYPGFYPPMAAPPKPGDPPPMFYPQFFYAPFPPPPQGPDGEAHPAYPHGYYPITIAPYAPQYPTPYMMPHPSLTRDGQPMVMAAPPGAYPYAAPAYMKPPTAEPPEANGRRADSASAANKSA